MDIEHDDIQAKHVKFEAIHVGYMLLHSYTYESFHLFFLL